MEEDVFKFINPKENDLLSQFTSKDKKQFLKLLSLYYIGYRPTLGYSSDYTFGMEIEFDDCYYKKVPRFDLSRNYPIKSEESLKNGGEVNTPILRDNKNDWQEFKKVCSMIKKYGNITYDCGGHIHFGFHVIKNHTQFLNLLKIWSLYENVLFHFYSGEFINLRKSIYNSTDSLRLSFFSILEKEEHGNLSIKEIYERYMDMDWIRSSLYFGNSLDSSYENSVFRESNTVELRCPNGTFNPIIWQNNVNAFLAILKYSTGKSFDDDFINYQINLLKNSSEAYTNKNYHKIDYLHSFQLVDLIFNNNLDKVNFLRQYIKDGRTSNNEMDLIKSKQFTKNIR